MKYLSRASRSTIATVTVAGLPTEATPVDVPAAAAVAPAASRACADPPVPLRERIARLSHGALLPLFASLVLCMFLADPGLNHYSPSSFGDMVYGRASRPFVYRTLVPTAVRLVSGLFPASAHAAATSAAQHTRLKHLVSAWDNLPVEYFLEFVIALAFMYGSLIGFLIALRRLAVALFELPDGFARKIPLIALVLLPVMFRYTSFIYDFPQLFLFTLGLVLMVRQRWRAYFGLLVVAAINKETAVLLPFVFGLYFLRHQNLLNGRFWPLLGAQLGLWLVIKLAINFVFRDNPGRMVELHLRDHNLGLLRSYSVGVAAAWLVLAVLMGVRWSDTPRFLRTALWVLPVLVGLTLFLGFLDELRDYYEAFPVIVLLVAHGVARLTGVAIKTVPEADHAVVR